MTNQKTAINPLTNQKAAYNPLTNQMTVFNTLTNYRDLRLGSIAGGADEIMLGIICKLADMMPSKQK